MAVLASVAFVLRCATRAERFSAYPPALPEGDAARPPAAAAVAPARTKATEARTAIRRRVLIGYPFPGRYIRRMPEQGRPMRRTGAQRQSADIRLPTRPRRPASAARGRAERPRTAPRHRTDRPRGPARGRGAAQR